jgi:hypothetical protein
VSGIRWENAAATASSYQGERSGDVLDKHCRPVQVYMRYSTDRRALPTMANQDAPSGDIVTAGLATSATGFSFSKNSRNRFKVRENSWEVRKILSRGCNQPM